MTLLNKIMNNTNIKVNDEVIANNSLMGAKSSSGAYLQATLESTTPEVRRMFGNYLTQCLQSHEAMTNLALKKGWYNPYQTPEEQIANVFRQSEWVLNADA